MRIVFDSFSTDLLADEKYIVGDEGEVFSGQTGIDNSFTTKMVCAMFMHWISNQNQENLPTKHRFIWLI